MRDFKDNTGSQIFTDLEMVKWLMEQPRGHGFESWQWKQNGMQAKQTKTFKKGKKKENCLNNIAKN